MHRLACASFASLVACALAHALTPAPAAACGGCFAPTGQPSVVTAHRMAISLSADSTTLWDLFEYAGAPEDFVWVLPVTGAQEVEVELAEQRFFQHLADLTRVTLQGPVSFGGGGGGGGFGCGGSDDSPGAAPAEDPNVTVYRTEVVGPYETAVIGSEDPGALLAWLGAHGYAVPEEMLPTIAHYVAQGMNFAVLRLSPGAGVQQMQPVRVTTRGLNVVFPLRMVAAGVSTDVSIELFVIGEGRWEAASFPNAEIAESELTYDLSTGRFDWDEVAAEKLAAAGGSTFLTEVAAPPRSADVGRVYDLDTASFVDLPDWAVAVAGIGGTPWITRMRAVLPVSTLSEDLVLRASTRGQRLGFYQVDATRSGAAPSPVRIGGGGEDALDPALVYPLLFAGLLCGVLVRRRARA